MKSDFPYKKIEALFLVLIFCVLINDIKILEARERLEHIFVQVEAASYLGNREKYSPAMAFDGRLDTVWAFETNKLPVKLKFRYGGGDLREFIKNGIEKICIFPGYGVLKGKYGNLYKANARVKRIKYESDNIVFKDKPIFQCVKGSKGLGSLEITDYYAGDTYKDLAISEIEIIPAGGLRKKKDYRRYIVHSIANTVSADYFEFRRNHILGGKPNIAMMGAEDELPCYRGRWSLKGNVISIEYKIYYPYSSDNPYKPALRASSKLFKAELYIQGVMKNGSLLIISNRLSMRRGDPGTFSHKN